MMGVPGQANHDGLIPRITKELYNNIDQNPNPDVKYKGTANNLELKNSYRM